MAFCRTVANTLLLSDRGDFVIFKVLLIKVDKGTEDGAIGSKIWGSIFGVDLT